MSIALTPISALDTLTSTSRLTQVASLLALNTSNSDLLTSYLNAATAMIRKLCCRNFNSDDFSEVYDGGGVPGQILQLREFPVTAISRVATTPTTVLTITNTATTTNQRATVATTATGLTLYRMASATPTTNTLTFASYTTITALANAVNALSAGGWSATVTSNYGAWPSVDLQSLQGAETALGTGAELILYTEDLPSTNFETVDGGWRLHANSGTLYGWFPRGFQNIRVDYAAGWASVPEDVQQACVDLVTHFYNIGVKDFSVSSEGSNGYTYSTSNVKGIPQPIKDRLSPYIDRSKRSSP